MNTHPIRLWGTCIKLNFPGKIDKVISRLAWKLMASQSQKHSSHLTLHLQHLHPPALMPMRWPDSGQMRLHQLLASQKGSAAARGVRDVGVLTSLVIRVETFPRSAYLLPQTQELISLWLISSVASKTVKSGKEYKSLIFNNNNSARQLRITSNSASGALGRPRGIG